MVVSENDSRPLFSLSPLCAICDADVCERAGWTLVDFASACLAGGARFLQVRAKHLPGSGLLDMATAIVRRADEVGALIVVNDRPDIARLAGAAGVHLGQDDVGPAAARTIAGADAVVGLSTHTSDQIDAAVRQRVSYIAIGPVFGTSTKATGYAAIGLDRVREAAGKAAARGLPVVAIGGITLDRASEVLEAGARSVAVITDLLSTGDPEARVRAYLALAPRRVRP